jgi:alkylated DNA repair protein alkB family protein 4
MDDPLPLPDLLAAHPGDREMNSTSHDRIHTFDLARQVAPNRPDFCGIRIYPDFISPREADQLLAEIETTAFKPAQSGKLKQHYGAKINFNKKKLNASSFRGLPRYGRWIESRARERAHADRSGRPADRQAALDALSQYETSDIFVLRYLEQEASNLDFHCDDTFAYGEVILDLSLESDSLLSFIDRPHSAGNSKQIECVRVPLPARSLAILYGPARFEWDHAILPYDISGRRTSITMRTLSKTLRETEEGERLLRVAKELAYET